MSNDLFDLPDDWRWARLADVAEIGSEQVQPNREPDRLFNYVALENVEQGTGRLIDFTQTCGGDIASNKFRFTPEHILYGKLRPYLRKALVPDFQGVSATDLVPLRPNPGVLDRRFLWRWLLSPDVLDYVVARQTGVKMPRLRTGDLQALPVPLPPLAEQLRIIERVEMLLAQSHSARVALEHVPALLKRFRQAVLAAAFRGELREQDPNDEPAPVLLERISEQRRRRREGEANGKSNRKSAPETYPASFSDLPSHWQWTTVEQTAEVIGGIQKTPARAPKTNAHPYLRVANVLRGRLDLSEVHEFELTDGELEKWKLKAGDVLIVEGNGSLNEIGRCALWSGEIANCVHQNHIIRVRFEEGIGPTYFHYYLNSSEGRRAISCVASSTSGLYTLSVSKVQRIAFPMAPLREQDRIVGKIGELFAQADTIERAVEVARRRAEKVDQAILARAFRGGAVVPLLAQ